MITKNQARDLLNFLAIEMATNGFNIERPIPDIAIIKGIGELNLNYDSYERTYWICFDLNKHWCHYELGEKPVESYAQKLVAERVEKEFGRQIINEDCGEFSIEGVSRRIPTLIAMTKKYKDLADILQSLENKILNEQRSGRETARYLIEKNQKLIQDYDENLKLRLENAIQKL